MHCSLTNFAFWGAFICPATLLKHVGDHYWLLISTAHLSGVLEAKIWSVSKCKYVPIDLWKNMLHYKVLSKKARKEDERDYEFANVCDTKKELIRLCYLEAWILCSTNSFLLFKKRDGSYQMMILLPTLCLTPLTLLKNHQSEWGWLWCIFSQSGKTQICSLIHGNGPKEETQKLFMILLSVWKTPSITSD